MEAIKPTTRDAIIEAAFLTFNAKPTASLGEVAERAGVGRATLHRHFAGREALMRALVAVAAEELDQAVDDATADAQTHEEGLRLALGAMIPLATRQWFLASEELAADAEAAAAQEAGRAMLRAEIEGAKAEGAFAARTPTAWIVHAYENLTYAAWLLVRDGEATPKQAAAFAWRTLTHGLREIDE